MSCVMLPLQDGTSMVDALPLPLVNRADVRVLYNDTACYAGPEARKVLLLTP